MPLFLVFTSRSGEKIGTSSRRLSFACQSEPIEKDHPASAAALLAAVFQPAALQPSLFVLARIVFPGRQLYHQLAALSAAAFSRRLFVTPAAFRCRVSIRLPAAAFFFSRAVFFISLLPASALLFQELSSRFLLYEAQPQLQFASVFFRRRVAVSVFLAFSAVFWRFLFVFLLACLEPFFFFRSSEALAIPGFICFIWSLLPSASSADLFYPRCSAFMASSARFSAFLKAITFFFSCFQGVLAACFSSTQSLQPSCSSILLLICAMFDPRFYVLALLTSRPGQNQRSASMD